MEKEGGATASCGWSRKLLAMSTYQQLALPQPVVEALHVGLLLLQLVLQLADLHVQAPLLIGHHGPGGREEEEEDEEE